MSGIAQLRRYRNVPAKRGMRVRDTHQNRLGTIRSARDGYLMIQLDGDKWPSTFHPTWRLDYLDDSGSIIKSCGD